MTAISGPLYGCLNRAPISTFVNSPHVVQPGPPSRISYPTGGNATATMAPPIPTQTEMTVRWVIRSEGIYDESQDHRDRSDRESGEKGGQQQSPSSRGLHVALSGQEGSERPVRMPLRHAGKPS